jgi:hypothetical protein
LKQYAESLMFVQIHVIMCNIFTLWLSSFVQRNLWKQEFTMALLRRLF